MSIHKNNQDKKEKCCMKQYTEYETLKSNELENVLINITGHKFTERKLYTERNALR